MFRQRIAFMLFLIFVFPSLVAASDIKGDRFEETSGRGLGIRTNPQGARVFIDGIDRGLTPLSLGNYSPGQYHVRLSREGYNERSFYVTLFNNSRLEVSIEMELTTGTALVSVNRAPESPEHLPFNPSIHVRNFNEAAASAQVNLPPGPQTIRVQAFGWEDASITVLIEENSTIEANIIMRPAAFRLENLSQSRRRFNPLNSNNLGINEYRFEVFAPGEGTFLVIQSGGFIVYTRKLDRFEAKDQYVTWNGRDSSGNPLPPGKYTILIEAQALKESAEGETHILYLRLETEINNAARIFPQSLDGGIAGMTFSPLPISLPGGSYQFEATALFSSFGFPFKIGMRAAPINRLELTAVFNVNPQLENQTGWGVSGSVMYNLIDGSGSVPLAFSAGASYAYASSNGEYALSPGRGVGLYLPLSLELKSFSIVFCPSVFWHGPAQPAPRLLLSAGALYRGSWLTGGLSMRYEIDFKFGSNHRFLAGAEINFFPQPSNFVVSAQGGIITQNSRTRGYGAIGIGVLF